MTRQAKPDGKRGPMGDRGYVLHGGIPWPALGDGTQYILKGDNAPFRVRHAQLTTETGTLQSVEWCHPDGGYMSDRMRPATKTRQAQAKPGAWWGIVAWDGRDEPGREPILAKHPLVNLVAESPEPAMA